MDQATYKDMFMSMQAKRRAAASAPESCALAAITPHAIGYFLGGLV
jgi:hypothetical protein